MKSLSRIGAIFIKELQDLKSNMGVLPIYIIPLLIVILYRSFLEGVTGEFTLAFGLIFLFTLVGVYGPSVSVSEEKEKNTLKVLILSPARPLEIIVGKGLTTFFTAAVGGIIIYFLSGAAGFPAIPLLAGGVLILATCIFLGMIVGILSPNQTVAGTACTPVYLFLLLFPIISLGQDNILATISRVLPTKYFFHLILYLGDFPEVSDFNLYFGFAFMGASMLISLVLLIFFFQSRGLKAE